MLDNRPFTYTDDIQGYQNAVWDFLLEHSEPSHRGKLYIKFGCDDKRNFENRVLARWKYNYHREDVEAKAKMIRAQEQGYREEKKKKKEKWRAEKKARMALKEISTHPGTPIQVNQDNIHSVLSRLRNFLKK